MASTITYDQFEVYAKGFVALSDEVGDSWELRSTNSIPAVVYMVKTVTQVVETSDLEYGSLIDQRVEEDLVEESDDATVQQGILQCHSSVRLEYHVVYSVSYEVPTLYLNASHTSGKSLSMNDIWKLIPSFYGPPTSAKWGILSQQDHPILNRPFYYIHPCHTATALSAVLSRPKDVPVIGATPDCTNYILTWLSMFGPLVGLNLSLKYCNIIHSTAINKWNSIVCSSKQVTARASMVQGASPLSPCVE